MICGGTLFMKLNVDDGGKDGWRAWMGKGPCVIPKD